jgi:aminoglycoside phosphotransferase family enzyme
MSWVFLAGDKVYKLKKPVRFPYLDFSTLERREAACRAEFNLNRCLAPDVYIDVTPLVASSSGLSLGGPGRVVDWLVVMRRLDDHWVLEQVLRVRAASRLRNWIGLAQHWCASIDGLGQHSFPPTFMWSTGRRICL